MKMQIAHITVFSAIFFIDCQGFLLQAAPKLRGFAGVNGLVMFPRKSPISKMNNIVRPRKAFIAMQVQILASAPRDYSNSNIREHSNRSLYAKSSYASSALKHIEINAPKAEDPASDSGRGDVREVNKNTFRRSTIYSAVHASRLPAATRRGHDF
jgi:hypothetical protein